MEDFKKEFPSIDEDDYCPNCKREDVKCVQRYAVERKCLDKRIVKKELLILKSELQEHNELKRINEQIDRSIRELGCDRIL